MSPMMLPAIPLVGSAALLALPRRAVSWGIAGASIAVEVLLVVSASAEDEILGVRLQMDGLTRLLLIALTLAAAAGTALAAAGNRRLAPYPLLILAPAAAALVTRTNPSVSALMLELAMLGIVPALAQEKPGETAGIQRYVTVVVFGGVLLVIAQALSDVYRGGPDPYLLKLILALGAVAWGVWIGIFPFHWWLPSLCRGSAIVGTTMVLGIIRPLGLAVFLGTTAATPWLLSDASSAGTLATAGGVAVLAAVALSFVPAQPLARLAYLAAADAGYVVVGAATGSGLGLTGALLATINHTLAMLLLLAGLTLRSGTRRGAASRLARQAKWMGTLGLGIGMLALLGMPPGSGFAGRWMIYQALWDTNRGLVALLLIASALTFLSLADLARAPLPRGIAGSGGTGIAKDRTALRLQTAVIAICGVLVLGIGLWPAPLVEAASAAVSALSGTSAW